MKRRPLLIACGAIAAANLAFQIAGCNDIGDAPPRKDPDSGPPAEGGAPLCQGDLQPMQIVGPDGKPTDGDFSCYSDTFDGSTVAPLPLAVPFDVDGGDGSLFDVDLDAILPDVLPGDGASDGGADAAPDANDGGSDGGPADSGATSSCHVSDFTSNSAVPNVVVDLFFKNDTAQPPDFTATTDNSGNFTFPTPTTDVLAYGVRPYDDAGSRAQLVPVYQFDNVAPKPGATMPANTITKSGDDLLSAGILGTTKVDPNKMSIVIGVRDCQYRDVFGGIVQIIDDSTGQVISTGAAYPDFRGAYFDTTGFPNLQCTHTVAVANQQYALYAALNVPTDRPITAKVYGRIGASDPPTGRLLGTRKVPAIPGAIVIIRPYKLTKK